jgi:hypothetical protein
MQRSGRFQQQFTSANAPSKPNFSVVIAYEDLDAGKNARRTYDYVAHQLGYDCHFTNEMWNFDVLGIPRLRELAARDARQADMIIIASHGDAPLPESVKAWIETWLSEEVNSMALVALFDAAHLATAGALEIRDYLTAVARRGNMEFFAQTGPWPPGTTSNQLLSSVLSMSADADPFSASVQFRKRHETFPHWGINE